MKNLVTLFVCSIVLASPSVSRAGGDGATITGVLLGAATGLIVANHSHGVSKSVAVPVGALLGGIVGHASANNKWSDYSRYNNRRESPYDGRYYRDYRRDRYDRDYGYNRRDRYEPPRVVVIRDERKERPAWMDVKAVDLHPGVDLVKVSVQFSSGIFVDVPILRTGNKFIGPQGEEYTSLPTAKELAVKYAK